MLMNLPEVLKGQKKPKMMRFKPIKVSRQTELWYSRQLINNVKALRNQVEGALQSQRPFLLDSAHGEAFNAQRFLEICKKLAESDRLPAADKLAREFVTRGNQQNEREVGENLKRQTGVDLQGFLGNSPKLAEKVELMTAANVQLISSISSQYLDKVQTAVTQAVLAGKMPKELAKEIKEIGNVTEKRARFIARDQSAKLNSVLTQARHEELGITKYRWSTSGDERVRDSHAENDGKVFSYAEPPETGHPGQGINCRCVAIPVLDLKNEIQNNKEEQNNKLFIEPEQYKIHLKLAMEDASAVEFIQKYGLTDIDVVSIRDYTVNGFLSLNSSLRKGNLSEKSILFERNLNRALSKLPNFTGVVTRYTKMLSDDDMARYEVGNEIVEKFFTSTSKKDFNERKPVKFIIRSKTGKFIKQLSGFSIEEEVLFKSKTKFKVLSKTHRYEQIIIEMEEI